eukprot:5885260-Pleurochrysis_carterae.AAC.1
MSSLHASLLKPDIRQSAGREAMSSAGSPFQAVPVLPWPRRPSGNTSLGQFVACFSASTLLPAIPECCAS